MIELTFNIYNLSLLIPFIIAMTFGLLILFTPSSNKRADCFLALILFIVALWNASILVLDLNIARYAVGIIWVPLTYSLALGPCLYLYIQSLIETDKLTKSKVWPHFVPVMIEITLFATQVFIGIPERKGYYQTELFRVVDPVVTGLAIISLMVYGYCGMNKIQNYHQWVKNNYSHYHRYNLNWLLRFTSVFMIFLVIWLTFFIIDYFFFDYNLTVSDYYPFYVSLAVISIWLSIESFTKPSTIYSDREIKNDKQMVAPTIQNIELQEKGDWLKNQIERNLLYLDPELSLKSLAETLDIHPNLTSKIINEGLNKTFSDCINEYRVTAVIKKLENDDESTLLAIAFDCGFNSKTTFNRIFKKRMGLTPLQYRNKISQ